MPIPLGKKLANPASLAVCHRSVPGFILLDMPRRLRNWSYKNVIDFLRQNGFRFDQELGGSHESWVKHGVNGEADRRVEVNFTHGSYPVLTLKTMIRQSGIDPKEWVKWAGS